MAAECSRCGLPINDYNKRTGKLCFQCQQQRLDEFTADREVPYYEVADLMWLLRLGNPESVKRLGRKVTIPGRIPGIKEHRYSKDAVNDWIRTGAKVPERTTVTKGKAEHRQAMRSLVERWSNELDIRFWEHSLKELGSVGIHRSPDPSGEGCDLVWEIGEGLKILLPHEVDEDEDTKGVKEYVHKRLEYSKWSWILEEMEEWRSTASGEMAVRRMTLQRVDDRIRDSIGRMHIDIGEIELAEAFSSTIVSAWIDRGRAELPYDLTPVVDEMGPHEVRYGGSVIALALGRQQAQQLQQIHKGMISFTSDEHLAPEVAVIRRARERRESLAKVIQQGLADFADTELE